MKNKRLWSLTGGIFLIGAAFLLLNFRVAASNTQAIQSIMTTELWGNPVPLFGVPLIYKIVLGLGVLAAVLTVGALVYTLLVWKNSYWGITARVYYTLVTIAAVAFVWFLNYWNLLGWRF